MKLDQIATRFRIDKPDKFKLADYDPGDCCGLAIDKDDAKALLKEGVERKTAGRCWSCCRPWTPPARTV